MNKVTCFLMLLLISQAVCAVTFQGWNWYNEKPAIILKRQNHKPLLQSQHTLSATQELANFQKALKEAKARAILYPTVEHIQYYLVLQNFIVDKSRRFAEVWQEALLRDPRLDYTVLHPTENNAQEILYSENEKRENAAIRSIAKDQGFLFFYRGREALDQAVAPIIADFAKKYGIHLLPVSIDHIKLSVFQHTREDHGESRSLKIRYYPALLLVNPKTRAVFPINYGYITQDELSARLLYVLQHFKVKS